MAFLSLKQVCRCLYAFSAIAAPAASEAGSGAGNDQQPGTLYTGLGRAWENAATPLRRPIPGGAPFWTPGGDSLYHTSLTGQSRDTDSATLRLERDRLQPRAPPGGEGGARAERGDTYGPQGETGAQCPQRMHGKIEPQGPHEDVEKDTMEYKTKHA